MNGGFCEELLSENDFDVLLATFCCYEHGANASETVQRIVTNQKEYSKYSLYIIICWISKIYTSFNECEKCGYKDNSNVVKKAADVAQKKSNAWPMVSFIHNRSEITTWMASKSKAQNQKQHF